MLRRSKKQSYLAFSTFRSSRICIVESIGSSYNSFVGMSRYSIQKLSLSILLPLRLDYEKCIISNQSVPKLIATSVLSINFFSLQRDAFISPDCWKNSLFFKLYPLLRRRAYRLKTQSVFPVFLHICIVELVGSSYIRFFVISRHSIRILKFTILPPLRLDYEMYRFLSKFLAPSLAQSLLWINFFALESNALTSLNTPHVMILFDFDPCYVVRPMVVCPFFFQL